MSRINEETFLVLSIHEVHAERIFRKQKLFELRKVLPKQPFTKIFLYQTGGKGLVGVFEVDEILHEKPTTLWNKVKENATPKERFFTYFADREAGYAIGIKRPLRFANSIDKDFLEKKTEKFTAPQSYLIVKPGTKMHKTLCAIYTSESKKKSSYQKSKRQREIDSVL